MGPPLRRPHGRNGFGLHFLGVAAPHPIPGIPPLQKGVLLSAQLRTLPDPSCDACHSNFFPLGYALENFDPLGRWRTEAEDEAIDASGDVGGRNGVYGAGRAAQCLARTPGRLPDNDHRETFRVRLGRQGRDLSGRRPRSACQPFGRCSGKRTVKTTRGRRFSQGSFNTRRGYFFFGGYCSNAFFTISSRLACTSAGLALSSTAVVRQTRVRAEVSCKLITSVPSG